VFNKNSSYKSTQKNLICSNVRFSSDRTTKKRVKMETLEKRYNNGIKNGEQSIIIKYFKGIPNILNTTKNRISHHTLV